MLYAIALPLLGALAAPWVHRLAGRHVGWVLSLIPLAVVVMLSWLMVRGVAQETLPWVPALDVGLSFYLDGLSATMSLLIAGIGMLIVLYAGGYLAADPRLGTFMAYLLMFMGAMLGVVLADDVITLFVFWELTSISSFLLIGFNHSAASARTAAMKALLVTGAGGLALLAGLLLMAIAAEGEGASWAEAMRLSSLRTIDLRGHDLYVPAVVLICAGAFAKSAQWPFHFWLPSAMEAPTPVSAYLHSATMVKAGVYLLARLNPMLGETPLWSTLLIAFGGVTMLVAAISAAGQSDLKKILAYTTLSVLGILVMLIGLGGEAAIKAAVVFLVAHALYKAALFMVAGNVDHGAGTRDVNVLSGLRRAMPMSAAAGLLATLSMAGAPPMFGFIGKELLYEANLAAPHWAVLLVALAVAVNAVMVLAALLAGVRPFWGAARPTPHHPHEAPASMLAGPIVLAATGLVVGVYPGPFASALGGSMASAILGETVSMKLALWHGVNPAALLLLGLSTLTMLLGIGLFTGAAHLRRSVCRMEQWLEPVSPTRGYEGLLRGLARVAEMHRRVMQHGYLRYYLGAVLLVLIAVCVRPVIASQPVWRADFGGVAAPEVVVVLAICTAAIMASVSHGWLTAIAALGVVGVGVTLLFVMFGAPDLAITQIMVETLTVILLVLVFYHLPTSAKPKPAARRFVEIAIAAGGGVIMAGLVIAAASVRLPPQVANYYAQASVPEAHGRNVVNVILVDFRALDTLGEITVIAVAAVGVYALLKLLPLHGERRPREPDA